MIFCSDEYSTWNVVIGVVFVWFFLQLCLIKKTLRNKKCTITRANDLICF